MTAWVFDPAIGKERSSALLKAPSFGEIVEAVAREMEILCVHRQACDDLGGFSRVVFNLRIPRATFDLFFNSEHGYRGAYFLSPHSGLAANEAVIRRITPLFLTWAEQNLPTLDRKFAEESLVSLSAKVWLTEYENHLCTKCEGEWGNPTDATLEIQNGRWEVADSPNGHRGRKAPFLSKLRVFGAFLNERYDEFVPGRKRHRARDLNECGWS
ncbi:hypothetical protein [Paraburkholderia sp. DGU8]|uniref:hypothetical protein n=1 Tax=Paraburkholderia sp. DGU8 TaxID=3161997 RepID=UPI0034673232